MNDGIVIGIAVTLIFFGSIAVCFVSYFRLQRHRVDGAAMAGYQTLAEQVANGQEALRTQLGELTGRLEAVEKLLRTVD
jgi:hypothetical protein